MQLAMVQDTLINLADADPVYFDRGLYFGDGVYEVVRSYGGRIFALQEHLDRCRSGLAAIGIDRIDMDTIGRRIRLAYERSSLDDAKIYFHVTRGSGPRDHLCPSDLNPNFFLTVTPLAPAVKVPDCSAVATCPDWRWKRCDIKSLNLLPNVLARRHAASQGCDEAVLVDDSGLITEGAASSFFAICNGRVHTAPLGTNILPSITRMFVLRAAAQAGLEVIEKSLTPGEAAVAEEIFLGVTTKGIVPVTSFDGRIISQGRCGRYTQRLYDALMTFTGT